MKGYIVNTLDEIAQAFGEGAVQSAVSRFACPRNLEVETFLNAKAFHSSRLGTSVTYLVFCESGGELVGYFTLALKPIEIPVSQLSGKAIRLLKRFSRLDDKRDSYTVAAYLIAQIGRNFSPDVREKITGDELLRLAVDRIQVSRRTVGGRLVFLECEKDRPGLKGFYERNQFAAWSERTDEREGVSYVQMFALLGHE